MAFLQELKNECAGIVPATEAEARAELNAFLMKDMESRPETPLYEGEEARKAFLRGIFMAYGLISDPKKSYYLEFTLSEPWMALELQNNLFYFGMNGKIVLRNQKYVLYLKDGDQISDFLKAIGAYKSMMKLEDVRVTKDVANHINRVNNCDTANIHKTICTGHNQIKDIEWIEENIGLLKLPEKLREMCMVRKENPEATLQELGELLDPPVGKSGVNHRLRQLHDIACGKVEL